MKISVVTAVFNAVETIEDTILSVASQTYPDVEHIVVDGSSIDGTSEVIERHLDVLANFTSEPDHGVYDAMNKGLARASGDVVGFLNADDVYVHHGVLQRVSEILADPRVDGCYADLTYVARNDPTCIVRRWKSCPYRPGLFERGWMPAHPTFFVRRNVYEQYGGFDTRFSLQADFDLTLRFIRIHGIQTVYVPEIWVRMRMGGLSNRSMRNIIKGNLEAWRICRKNALPVPSWVVVRKIVSRIPQFMQWP